MPKLFIVNAEHETLAVSIPKALYKALNWKQGDIVDVKLGRDRTIILNKE